MRRRSLLAIGSTVIGFGLVLVPLTPAYGATATLVSETFTGATTSSQNWVLPDASVSAVNDACLTGSSNTSQTPVPGCAASAGTAAGLQLTPNTGGQEGGLAYSSSVPASLGLDVRFTTYQYDGSGADGIVFFLAASDPNNASASPITLGPPGGHLGYSADTVGQTAGLTHGYLGVGLDVFGNYARSSFAGSGCADSSDTSVPSALAVRGPGNGLAGYCLLSDSPAGTIASLTPQAVPVEVAVNPTDNPLTAAGGFTVAAHSYHVEITSLDNTTPLEQAGPLPDATDAVPDGSWVDGKGVPLQLSFGWSASTGSSTDFHTISGVTVQTLNGTPPTLAVNLTDNSGGAIHNGQTVTYSAATTLSGADESRPITLTDVFPTGLVPQSTGLGGTGWSCGLSGQTVTCTHAAASIGALAAVAMPAVVSVPIASPPATLTDSATAGSPDATQGTGTDTEPVAVAQTSTALGFLTQPVSSQVNTTMKHADNTTTHIKVAAQVSAGGATDTTYNGTVQLAFANNPGNASFVVAGVTHPTLTAQAVNGVADFSPIVINAVGFGYTLTASASGLSPATSTSFDVSAAATSCASGKTCTVTTSSTSTGQKAQIVAQPGAGNAIITASFGGNVTPIHPCTGATASVLTFSGNRQKLITITMQTKLPVLFICYGQPTPFLDITLRPTTYFSPTNHDYEGVLPYCRALYSSGPCIKSLKFAKKSETVVIQSGAADPHIMT